jgi:hypothetical protein
LLFGRFSYRVEVYLPNEAKWMHDYEKTKQTHFNVAEASVLRVIHSGHRAVHILEFMDPWVLEFLFSQKRTRFSQWQV